MPGNGGDSVNGNRHKIMRDRGKRSQIIIDGNGSVSVSGSGNKKKFNVTIPNWNG